MSNVLNYVNYDFNDLVVQLQDRLKEKAAWQDIYRSGTGQTLIELLAYVANLALYYTERRAEESFLPTAQQRSSLVNLVSLLNYQPRRKTSATGTLKFSLDAAHSNIVYIPKYTECESDSGYKYVTNEPGAIQKGQTSVSLSAIQGELVQKEITSDGSVDQEYKINNTNVENSASTTNPTFRVIVDGEEWTKVSSFLDSVSTSQHYRVINENDGSVSVLFGDDVNGKSPDAGSIIVLQYIVSNGEDGNVSNTGVITTINDPVYDEDSAVITVSVTNTSSFLGGSDEEGIEEIRSEAPEVFKTGDRAVSKTDFEAILKSISSVSDANVWGENEEAEAAGTSAVQTMLNKVKISMILTDWELPDASFKSTVSDTLYAKSMLTVKYEFVDPTIVYVMPRFPLVRVAKGYSQSETQADIVTALQAAFKLGDTTEIGTVIKYSNVLADIDNLEGVSYANMILELRKVLTSTYNSNYDWGGLLELTDVLPESARLYIGDTYVTTDVNNKDGTGSFTTSGEVTVSGTINYSTGEVLLNMSPVPTGTVNVRYQQDSNGNLVPGFSEICKYYDLHIQDIEVLTT